MIGHLQHFLLISWEIIPVSWYKKIGIRWPVFFHCQIWTMGRINVSEQHLFVENPKSMSVSVPWRFSFKYGVTKVCVAVLSSAKLKVTKESTTSNLLLWLLNLPQTRINVHTICLDIP